MNEQQGFRTSFRGFSKEDVLTYIDSLRATLNEEREEHAEEMAAMRSRLEDVEAKLTYLNGAEQREAQLRAEIETTQETVRTLTEQNAALTDQLQAAQKQIAANRETEMAEALSQSAEEMRLLRERENALNTQLAETHKAVAALWQEKEGAERKVAVAADFADALQVRVNEFKQQLGSVSVTESAEEPKKSMERWLF